MPVDTGAADDLTHLRRRRASAPPSPPKSRCRWSARSTPITALLAEAAGFKALYLSGGGVAAGSLGMPDLGITTLDDVLTDVRRITDVSDAAAAGRCRHRLGAARSTSPAPSVADQGRRGGAAHRGPGRRQALRPPPGQGARVAERDGRPHQGRGGCAHRSGFRDHGAHRRAGRRGPARPRIDRAAAYVEAGADMIFPEAITELAMYRQFADARRRCRCWPTSPSSAQTPLFTRR